MKKTTRLKLAWCIVCLMIAKVSIVDTKAADGFWVLGKDLSLTNQIDWRPYDSIDSPEGAYMGWLWEGKANLLGDIDLGRTIAPGDYYVMAKVLDYMGKGKLSFAFGPNKVVVETVNEDSNKHWTVPSKIRVQSPTNKLQIDLLRSPAGGPVQKYLLKGLYITTNEYENVPLYGIDRIVNYKYPTDAPVEQYQKGNQIPDGSFETGFAHGWGFLAAGYAREMSLSHMWATNSGADGSSCVRFLVQGNMISRVFRVRANRKHTLSFSGRAAGRTGVRVSIENVATPPPGYSNVVKVTENFILTPNWARFSLTGNLLDYPYPDYQITISGNVGTEIDAIQLEEGSLTPFAPSAPVEIGFYSDKPSRIYYADENPAMQIIVANSSSKAFSGPIHYEVYDIFNDKVATGDISAQVPAESVRRIHLPLPQRRGIFRILGYLPGKNRTVEEVVYSVVPRPASEGLDTSSNIGIHPNLVSFQLASLQRLGVKWARAMSPEPIFRWADVELTEGEIKWHDEKVNRAKDYGLTIMGSIGSNRYWPAWADENGQPNLDKWESFVERLVTHYKGQVKYWEVWNEPIYSFTVPQYGELLKRAGLAIRRADPTAKIVGIGGVYERDWVVKVIEYLGADWKNYMDIASTHLYAPGTDSSEGEAEDRYVEFRKRVIDRFGIEVWNTETGVWDQGFYKTLNSSFSPEGEPMRPNFDSDRFVRGCYYESERMLANFIHGIGNGLTKYFYYDSRLYVTPAHLKHHPTILEFDDSIRSKGIAYSIAGHFLDRSKAIGAVSPDTKTVYAYLFERAGKTTVALWSKDKGNHTIQVSGLPFTAYDMMGNAVGAPNGQFRLGRTQMYVEFGNASASIVSNAFKSAVVAKVADVIAPNVSIDEFPVGATRDRSVRLRWTGIDETSVPHAARPNAVVYSYKLEGLDEDWSSWSAKTFITPVGLQSGDYTLQVRAKDEAGNISAPETRSFTVRGPIRPPSGLAVIQ